MPERSLSNTCFLHKSLTAFCVYQHQTALLHYAGGAILNSGVTNKKHKNAKKTPLNIRSQKGQLFTTGELKEGRTLLCSTSAGNVAVEQVNYFATLHMSTNDRESTEYGPGVTNGF